MKNPYTFAAKIAGSKFEIGNIPFAFTNHNSEFQIVDLDSFTSYQFPNIVVNLEEAFLASFSVHGSAKIVRALDVNSNGIDAVNEMLSAEVGIQEAVEKYTQLRKEEGTEIGKTEETLLKALVRFHS